jgi:hypothetical protein
MIPMTLKLRKLLTSFNDDLEVEGLPVPTLEVDDKSAVIEGSEMNLSLSYPISTLQDQHICRISSTSSHYVAPPSPSSSDTNGVLYQITLLYSGY